MKSLSLSSNENSISNNPNQSSKRQPLPGSPPPDMCPQHAIQMHQIIAMAMAAAASIKSMESSSDDADGRDGRRRSPSVTFDDFGLYGNSRVEIDAGGEDDDPPEMFVDATG